MFGLQLAGEATELASARRIEPLKALCEMRERHVAELVDQILNLRPRAELLVFLAAEPRRIRVLPPRSRAVEQPLVI